MPSIIIYLLLKGFVQTPLLINQPMGEGHLWLEWQPKISIIIRQALKFGDHHRATPSNTKVAIYFPFAGLRRNLKHGTLHSLAGWWFQKFFNFPFHM
jgi:hypothetical protein